MPRAPRLLIALLVAAVLASTAAVAAPRQAAAPHSSGTVLEALKTFLPDLWNSFNRLWADNGCNADPYGGNYSVSSSVPPTGNPRPTLDNGCGIDPYGGTCGH